MDDVCRAVVEYCGDWFDCRGYEMRRVGYSAHSTEYEILDGVRRTVIDLDFGQDSLLVVSYKDVGYYGGVSTGRAGLAFFVELSEPDAFEALDEILNGFILRKLRA